MQRHPDVLTHAEAPRVSRLTIRSIGNAGTFERKISRHVLPNPPHSETSIKRSSKYWPLKGNRYIWYSVDFSTIFLQGRQFMWLPVSSPFLFRSIDHPQKKGSKLFIPISSTTEMWAKHTWQSCFPCECTYSACISNINANRQRPFNPLLIPVIAFLNRPFYTSA